MSKKLEPIPTTEPKSSSDSSLNPSNPKNKILKWININTGAILDLTQPELYCVKHMYKDDSLSSEDQDVFHVTGYFKKKESNDYATIEHHMTEKPNQILPYTEELEALYGKKFPEYPELL